MPCILRYIPCDWLDLATSVYLASEFLAWLLNVEMGHIEALVNVS